MLVSKNFCLYENSEFKETTISLSIINNQDIHFNISNNSVETEKIFNILINKYNDEHNDSFITNTDCELLTDNISNIDRNLIKKLSLDTLKKISGKEFRLIQDYINSDILSKSLKILPWDFSRIHKFKQNIDPTTLLSLSSMNVDMNKLLKREGYISFDLIRYILLTNLVNKYNLDCKNYNYLYKKLFILLTSLKDENLTKTTYSNNKNLITLIFRSYKELVSIIKNCDNLSDDKFKKLVDNNVLISYPKTPVFNKMRDEIGWKYDLMDKLREHNYYRGNRRRYKSTSSSELKKKYTKKKEIKKHSTSPDIRRKKRSTNIKRKKRSISPNIKKRSTSSDVKSSSSSDRSLIISSPSRKYSSSDEPIKRVVRSSSDEESFKSSSEERPIRRKRKSSD